MDDLIKVLISMVTMTVLSFTIVFYQNRKKKTELLEKERRIQEKVLTSPKTSWKKVGTIKQIFFYPLKSGKGKSVKQCNFEKNGISVNQQGLFDLKDRMFLIYDENTGKYKTAQHYSKLLLIDISAVDEDHARLQAAGMSDMKFKLPNINDKNARQAKCFVWFNEPVKCLDCGTEISTWISKFLTGLDSGLRLGVCLPDNKRNVTKGSWEKHASLHKTLRDEDAGLFSYLASYMVLSNESIEDLNERLSKPINPLQLRPNLIVEGCKPYAEDEWEWIKIGEKAIIRNVKLCTRCKIIGIDPNTGILDPKSEALKTLRTYRKLKNAELDALENHAPHMGIYCGLYQVGSAKLGDEVFVYQTS